MVHLLTFLCSATVLPHAVLAIGPPEHAQKYNSRTAEYYVDAASIPRVDFDVGESYAGQMPIGNASNMFFWFFPTVNPAGSNDVVIWLNGGPGCSSLEGLLEENGPISWRPGTDRSIANPWSWHKLANVVWYAFTGTGFSHGPITAQNDSELALQFVDFWANFSSTFALKDSRIFLTGESYGGVHIPYIGAAFLDKNDSSTYNIRGALIYDPTMPYVSKLGLDRVSIPAFARYWRSVLAFSTEGLERVQNMSQQCGLDRYLAKYLSFPAPSRPWPAADPACPITQEFFQNAITANNCYNPYHIQDTCPLLSDILGAAGQSPPKGKVTWPNLPDVQKALHVTPASNWSLCQAPVFAGPRGRAPLTTDDDEHGAHLRTLIERTHNVIIASGLADGAVFTNSTALAIQHLEWNDGQGFTSAAQDPFVLPVTPRTRLDPAAWSAGGEVGAFHTERGLTFSTVFLAGHEFPQYAPSAAFRHLEVVLGRVKSLGAGEPYSVKITTSFTWPF